MAFSPLEESKVKHSMRRKKYRNYQAAVNVEMKSKRKYIFPGAPEGHLEEMMSIRELSSRACFEKSNS